MYQLPVVLTIYWSANLKNHLKLEWVEPLLESLWLNGIAVECPDCHSTDIIKHVNLLKTNNASSARILTAYFVPLSLTYPGRTRLVLQQMVEMSLNSSGIRDMARVLKVGSLTDFQESMQTIKRWFGEVVGYFERGRTNGVVEGINNKLKLIKRFRIWLQKL